MVSITPNLPPGTMILADQEETQVMTSWRSSRGLHIVTMKLPTARILDEDEPEYLENALLEFVTQVSLEALAEKMAEADAEA